MVGVPFVLRMEFLLCDSSLFVMRMECTMHELCSLFVMRMECTMHELCWNRLPVQ